MALQISKELPSGITCPDAYCMITEFFISKRDKRVGMQVAFYRDKAARDAEMEPLEKQKPYEVYDNYISKSNIKINGRIKVTEGTINVLSNQTVLGSVTCSSTDTIESVTNSLTAALPNFDVLNDGVDGISIAAKDTGNYSGALGSSVTVSGDGFLDYYTVSGANDAIASDFDTYFSALLTSNIDNPLAQCYAYLKDKIPEFSNAIDV